jgi:hypothetical protein
MLIIRAAGNSNRKTIPTGKCWRSGQAAQNSAALSKHSWTRQRMPAGFAGACLT